MLIKLLFKNKSSIAQNKTYILLKKQRIKTLLLLKKNSYTLKDKLHNYNNYNHTFSYIFISTIYLKKSNKLICL